jgi:hypothetical protein
MRLVSKNSFQLSIQKPFVFPAAIYNCKYMVLNGNCFEIVYTLASAVHLKENMVRICTHFDTLKLFWGHLKSNMHKF